MVRPERHRTQPVGAVVPFLAPWVRLCPMRKQLAWLYVKQHQARGGPLLARVLTHWPAFCAGAAVAGASLAP